MTYEQVTNYMDFNPFTMSSAQLADFIASTETRKKVVADHFAAVRQSNDLLNDIIIYKTAIALIDETLQMEADDLCKTIRQSGLDYKQRREWQSVIREADTVKDRLIQDLRRAVDNRWAICKEHGLSFREVESGRLFS